ncbi:HepT-like ribonuclease domain-containing protein [Sulfurimonas sp.]|uniref:HepT-like ribonuclease domain-containing protein n=1 Tax=Sulfurimonas sp. TaxID=2022749 RepID=UPI003D0E3F10
MSRVSELFLFDILVAIHKIKETVKNQTDGNELKHNYMAWDTVIREFEIIGEATKHLIESGTRIKSRTLGRYYGRK